MKQQAIQYLALTYSSTRAYPIFRALARPFDTIAFSTFRSSPVSRTMYFFAPMSHPPAVHRRSDLVREQLAVFGETRH